MTETQILQSLFQDFAPRVSSDLNLLSQGGKQDFSSWVEQRCENLNPRLRERIQAEIFAWGPLEEICQQPDLFDILIQGPEDIWFETSTGMHRCEDRFLSEISFRNFYERLLIEANQSITQRDPFANGQVRDFRLHMSAPPASEKVQITLRKKRSHIFTLDQLQESQFLKPQHRQCLEDIIAQRESLLIVGPTGSGKTTFLNALLAEVPSTERLVLLEDTRELTLPHPLAAQLSTREVCPETMKPISLTDLLRQSLRMRPDRLIVGEVRGQEAKDLLLALATGHCGSMGTLHAENAHQAVLRLEMLIQMGAPQWALESIRRLIQLSLTYLIVLKRDRLNKGVQDIYRIASVESFGLTLQPVCQHPAGTASEKAAPRFGAIL